MGKWRCTRARAHVNEKYGCVCNHARSRARVCAYTYVYMYVCMQLCRLIWCIITNRSLICYSVITISLFSFLSLRRVCHHIPGVRVKYK